MKWITKDCYGNTRVWYSEDVIENLKQECSECIQQYINNDYPPEFDKYIKGGVIIAQKVIDFLNEVDE